MYCHHCGTKAVPGDIYCAKCGIQITSSVAAAPTLIKKDSKSLRFAGFWLRAVAIFVDYIAVCFMFGLLSSMLDVSSTFILFLGIVWLYHAAFECSAYQGTFGKMLVGLVVTDMQGKPIGFPRAAVRSLCRFLSFVLLGIGFLMAAFTERKQALHDMIADCLVMKKKA